MHTLPTPQLHEIDRLLDRLDEKLRLYDLEIGAVALHAHLLAEDITWFDRSYLTEGDHL